MTRHFTLSLPGPGADTRTCIQSVHAGETVLDAIRHAGQSPYTPCAGRGKCGKCRIIAQGGLAAPTDAERDHLTPAELAAGVRLACQARIVGDVAIQAVGAGPDTFTSANILLGTHGFDRADSGAPRSAEQPQLQSQPCSEPRSPSRVRGQPCVDACRAGLGVALDIGTTTLVAYLVDCTTGAMMDAAGTLNPQAAHGADLISRIAFSETPGGLEMLRREVTQAANDLVHTLLSRQGISGDDVRWVSAVGNTCMHHLFLGIPAEGLGRIPYAAAVLDTGVMPAASAGLTSVSPEASFFFLPNIAGFVGSDALAVALVAGMDEHCLPTLAIDIGTNGEILLAANGRILASSAAAGPAFEGVNISSGMIADQGAIDWVGPGYDLPDSPGSPGSRASSDSPASSGLPAWSDLSGFSALPGSRASSDLPASSDLSGLSDLPDSPPGDIEIHVIGGIQPRGICGSGLISLIAALRKAKLVSETGAFEPEAIDADSPLARRLAIGPGGIEFVLSDPESGMTCDDSVIRARVALTQRDIRELQLAKAAIRAGVEVLLEEANISASELNRIALAGAFGTYLDKDAAQAIGILPRAPHARITALGNAAGEGAALAVASRDAYREARRLASIIEHVELGANPRFMQVFADSMLLA